MVRPVELRAFPVHPDTRQPRGGVERVALVGPPAVDAEGEDLAMRVPVTGGLLLDVVSGFGRVATVPLTRLRADDDVRHTWKCIACSSSSIALGSGKTDGLKVNDP